MACITINTKYINFVTVFNSSLDIFNSIKILKLIFCLISYANDVYFCDCYDSVYFIFIIVNPRRYLNAEFWDSSIYIFCIIKPIKTSTGLIIGIYRAVRSSFKNNILLKQISNCN